MNTAKQKIEEILRNRILFIGKKGEGTPEFKDTDHQVYTGYPQQLISELQALIDSEVKRVLSEIVKKNTDDTFGTVNFDGVAKDVLTKLKEGVSQ